MNTTPNPLGRPPLDGEPAEAHIMLRVTQRRKSTYVRAANRRKQKLTHWATEHLDKASGYKPKTP